MTSEITALKETYTRNKHLMMFCKCHIAKRMFLHLHPVYFRGLSSRFMGTKFLLEESISAWVHKRTFLCLGCYGN